LNRRHAIDQNAIDLPEAQKARKAALRPALPTLTDDFTRHLSRMRERMWDFRCGALGIRVACESFFVAGSAFQCRK
jgi:hypothetical protein